VLAAMCGMTYGFRAVLMLAALCYLAALAASIFVAPRFTSNPETNP